MPPFRDDQILVIAPGSQITLAQVGLPESYTPARLRIPTRMFPAEKADEWEPFKVREKSRAKPQSNGDVDVVMADADGQDTSLMEEEESYIEDLTSEEGAVYPIRDGRVVNWTCFFALLTHIHRTFDPPFHTPVLLIAQPAWTPQDRETLTQFFFEKFKIPAFCIMDASLAVCYAYAVATATVVDVGYTKCDITAVRDFLINEVGRGVALPESGGQTMTQRLLNALEGKGFNREMCEQLKRNNICEILPPGTEIPIEEQSAEAPQNTSSAGLTASDGTREASSKTSGDVGDAEQDQPNGEDDEGVLDVASIVASGKASEFLAQKEREKAARAAARKSAAAEAAAASKQARLPNSKRARVMFQYHVRRPIEELDSKNRSNVNGESALPSMDPNDSADQQSSDGEMSTDNGGEQPAEVAEAHRTNVGAEESLERSGDKQPEITTENLSENVGSEPAEMIAEKPSEPAAVVPVEPAAIPADTTAQPSHNTTEKPAEIVTEIATEAAVPMPADTAAVKIEAPSEKPYESSTVKSIEAAVGQPLDLGEEKSAGIGAGDDTEKLSTIAPAIVTGDHADKPVENGIGKHLENGTGKSEEMDVDNSIETSKPAEMDAERLVETDAEKPIDISASKPAEFNEQPVETDAEKTTEMNTGESVEMRPEEPIENGAGSEEAAAAARKEERREERRRNRDGTAYVRREIEVGPERFEAASDGLLDRVADAIHRCILSVPETSKRSELWESLIIVGNGSKVKGFKEALMATLNAKYLISPSSATIFSSELPSNFTTPVATGANTPQRQLPQQSHHGQGVNPLLLAATTASNANLAPPGQQLHSQLQLQQYQQQMMQQSSPHSHSQTPTSIKFLKSPEYFPEWKEVGMEEASFLGAQVAAKVVFVVDQGLSKGFMSRTEYNDLGPPGIHESAM